MIRSLQLTAWKAFDALNLDLTGGTTFIVARNGIGKTSIMQAVEYALFGQRFLPFSADSAVRQAAGDQARVAIQVTLPSGGRLTIARTVPAEVSRHRRPGLEAEYDGRSLAESELEEVLTDEFGADVATLHRLAFLPEGAVIQEIGDPFNLNDHVSRIFHIEEFSRLAERATALQRQFTRTGDAVRRVERRSTADISLEMEGQLMTLEDRSRELLARRLEIQRDLTGANAQVSSLKDWMTYRDRVSAENRRVEEVLASVRETLSVEVETGAAIALENAAAAAQVAVGLASRSYAEAQARLRLLHEGLERLRDAGSHCPVCRRPLNAEERKHAETEYATELATTEANLSTADQQLRQAEQRATQLSALQAALEARAIEAPAGPEPNAPEEVLLASVEELGEALRLHDQEVGAIQAERSQLQEQLREVQERDTGWRNAVGAYRRAELADLLAATLSGYRDHIVRERVEPLRKELAGRYEEFWSGRLNFDDDGSLSLERQGFSVGFRHLSGGERAFAVVLLRILAQRMMTRGRFLWLDEPLEHVDPRNRRILAALLSEVTMCQEMLQVVVTTYEERVTRRLASLPKEGVGARVVYVDSEPQSRIRGISRQ